MTSQSVDHLLETLELLTEQVIEVIISHQPQRLESLVIDQCRYLRELQMHPVEVINKTRIKHLHERVMQQQTLISQALQVTDFFLSRMNESPTFQTLG